MGERTPGPWRAKGRTIMNADGVKIATVTVHSGGKNFKPNEVAEANAAFIVDACNRADLVEPLVEALRETRHWARSRCPCRDETPEPCPLCGATVDGEGLDGVCKSVEATFPRTLLVQLNAAIQAIEAAQ